MKTITTKNAVLQAIHKSMIHIWTDYTLGILLFKLYKTRKYKEYSLKIRKPHPSSVDYNRLISGLLEDDDLQGDLDDARSVVFKLPSDHSIIDGETVCAVDPFSYISHLSAMEHYKLTEKQSEQLIISSPTANNWKQKAIDRMQTDLESSYDTYASSGLPVLRRINPEKLEPREVYRYSSSSLGKSKSLNYDRIRVSVVERVFLDMLKRPDLCGGVEHVLDVYQKHVMNYLNPVVAEIDAFGNKIEKVRAGYILEECCGVKNDIVSRWVEFAQRGGSRKLDPLKKYAPRYSERWCLSINI